MTISEGKSNALWTLGCPYPASVVQASARAYLLLACRDRGGGAALVDNLDRVGPVL
jgi:hypothetical protein